MRILDIFRLGRNRRRAFDSVRHLDDHLLRDIGFERELHGRFVGRDLARLQDFGR